MMKLVMDYGPELDESRIRQVKVRQQIDPVMGRLLPGTMELQLRDADILPFMAKRQSVARLYWGSVPFATQYMTGCTSRGGWQLLQCRTDTEYLRTEFRGALYQNEPVEDVMYDIMGDRDYALDEGLLPYVSGHIPICTRGQALNMLSFAQGGCLQVDKYGMMHLKYLSLEAPTQIGPERILRTPNMLTQVAYSEVDLTAHDYTPGSQWVTVFRDREFGPGNQTEVFKEPVYRHQLTNGTILESGPNYVTFLPGETDTLQILPYLHSRSWHNIVGPDMQGYDHHLQMDIRDNTLIGSHNATEMLNRLYDRAILRQKLQLRILVEKEQVGQAVQVDTPWGTRFVGYISCMDSTLTPQSHVAELTVLGRET